MSDLNGIVCECITSCDCLENKIQSLEAENAELNEKLKVYETVPGETGWGQQHEAWRYRHLHEAVERMGGWANYRHWFIRHGEDYFRTCDKLEKENDRLINALKEIRSIDWGTDHCDSKNMIADKALDMYGGDK